MGQNNLASETRTDTGKGIARRLRAAGRIPAVLYGKGREPRALSVDSGELERLLHTTGAGMNTLIDLQGEGGEEVVLVKELQREPVYGKYLHADFYVVDLTQTVDVQVPIHFVGKAAGLDMGGIIEHALREIELECLPRSIPEAIEVDVTSLELGDSIHVRDLVLPDGVSVRTDGDLSVASCVQPKVVEEETPEGELAEGEEAAAEGAEGAEGAEASGGDAAKGDDS